MNVRDSLIIDWVQTGDTVSEIIKKLQKRDMPTAKKTVAKVLKEKGFRYDRKSHKWYKGADNVELMEVNENEGLPIQNTSSVNVEPLEENALGLLNVLGLSPQQFNALKSIADERLNRSNQPDNINAAITQLKARDRGNKTFYISKDIAQDAALFAERNGIKLSQLVEIALLETMRKYKES